MDIKFGEKLIETIEIAGHKIPTNSMLHILLTYHTDTSNTTLEIITATEPNTIEVKFDSLKEATKTLKILARHYHQVPQQSINEQFLSACKKEGMDKFINILNNKKPDINYRCEKTGKYPVHFAMENLGDVIDKIELLLQAGADVNARDRKGNTPLHIAAQKRWASLCIYLINKGANVNARNEDNNNFLDEFLAHI